MQNYRQQSYWKNYQQFFPANLRVSDATAPDEEWFEWQGNSIHIDRYPADASPITVIVVHGAGGYGRLFTPIGHMLSKAGYEVIAPDLPGYGLTKTKTSFITYDAWVELLCDLIVAEYKNTARPIVLCGGSLGGYLAYLCAAKLGSGGPVEGIIATTLADPRLGLTRQQFARNALVLHLGLPLLPVLARMAGSLRLPIKWFTKMDAMSNDSDLSKIVALDPLGGGAKLPIGFMNSIFTIKPSIEPEYFDVCPILLAHPAADRWTDIASSKLFFDRLKCPKSLALLENCGHFPIESPGIDTLEEVSMKFLDKVCQIRESTLTDLAELS